MYSSLDELMKFVKLRLSKRCFKLIKMLSCLVLVQSLVEQAVLAKIHYWLPAVELAASLFSLRWLVLSKEKTFSWGNLHSYSLLEVLERDLTVFIQVKVVEESLHFAVIKLDLPFLKNLLQVRLAHKASARLVESSEALVE